MAYSLVFYFFPSDNMCLLICIYKSFLFNVIFDVFDFKLTILLVFSLFPLFLLLYISFPTFLWIIWIYCILLFYLNLSIEFLTISLH